MIFIVFICVTEKNCVLKPCNALLLSIIYTTNDATYTDEIYHIL